MRRVVIALGLTAATIGCGGTPKPPARAVIESNVGGWSFRRYQEVLDVEVWVPDNRAAAHTASYVHGDALKRGHVAEDDVVNAFVTRYASDTGVLRALVKFVRRLASESGYRVEEREVEDVQLFWVEGTGEVWAMWAADRHIVKIGGRGRTGVPGDVIEAYGERYPSHLKEGMLEGDLPDGPDVQPEQIEKEPFDPDNPHPDWDHDRRRKREGKKK